MPRHELLFSPSLPAAFSPMPFPPLRRRFRLWDSVSKGCTPVPGYWQIEGGHSQPCSALLPPLVPGFHRKRCPRPLRGGVHYSPSFPTRSVKCNLFSNFAAVAGLATRSSALQPWAAPRCGCRSRRQTSLGRRGHLRAGSAPPRGRAGAGSSSLELQEPEPERGEGVQQRQVAALRPRAPPSQSLLSAQPLRSRSTSNQADAFGAGDPGGRSRDVIPAIDCPLPSLAPACFSHFLSHSAAPGRRVFASISRERGVDPRRAAGQKLGSAGQR